MIVRHCGLQKYFSFCPLVFCLAHGGSWEQLIITVPCYFIQKLPCCVTKASFQKPHGETEAAPQPAPHPPSLARGPTVPHFRTMPPSRSPRNRAGSVSSVILLSAWEPFLWYQFNIEFLKPNKLITHRNTSFLVFFYRTLPYRKISFIPLRFCKPLPSLQLCWCYCYTYIKPYFPELRVYSIKLLPLTSKPTLSPWACWWKPIFLRSPAIMLLHVWLCWSHKADFRSVTMLTLSPTHRAKQKGPWGNCNMDTSGNQWRRGECLLTRCERWDETGDRDEGHFISSAVSLPGPSGAVVQIPVLALSRAGTLGKDRPRSAFVLSQVMWGERCTLLARQQQVLSPPVGVTSQLLSPGLISQ